MAEKKRILQCRAACHDCKAKSGSRVAENWAKTHAKKNPFHRVVVVKAWVIEAPVIFRASIRKT